MKICGLSLGPELRQLIQGMCSAFGVTVNTHIADCLLGLASICTTKVIIGNEQHPGECPEFYEVGRQFGDKMTA